MPPSEAEILTDYLLKPAPLTNFTNPTHFAAQFPARLRASPQVRRLFRDLQGQRNEVLDGVRAAIAAEARRGAAVRAEMLREQRRALEAAPDAEADLERALVGGEAGGRRGFSIESVMPEMESAREALEEEVRALKEEEERLLAWVRRTVGGLSDLRYGRLANPRLREEVLDGLEALQKACEERS